MAKHLLSKYREVLNIDAVDKDNCSSLWVAAYNGVEGAYQVTMLLLNFGCNVELKGISLGVSLVGASLAARAKRNGSIADLIDLETKLRKGDKERIGRLLRGEVAEDVFKESLRQASGR